MFAVIRALDFPFDNEVAGSKLLIATDCQSVVKKLNSNSIESKLSLEARLELNRVSRCFVTTRPCFGFPYYIFNSFSYHVRIFRKPVRWKKFPVTEKKIYPVPD